MDRSQQPQPQQQQRHSSTSLINDTPSNSPQLVHDGLLDNYLNPRPMPIWARRGVFSRLPDENLHKRTYWGAYADATIPSSVDPSYWITVDQLEKMFPLGGPNVSNNNDNNQPPDKEIPTRVRWKDPRQRRSIVIGILMNNSLVPLSLRMIIFGNCIIALGLGCKILVATRNLGSKGSGLSQQPSTIMTLCVQSIAVVYLFYITYDEYSGKPLGLRSAKSKMRLIMLDLLFIIFSSANLALAFNTLFDTRWICHVSEDADSNAPPYNGPVCVRQRTLAAFLFIVLVMWVLTFTISMFRLVERVTGTI